MGQGPPFAHVGSGAALRQRFQVFGRSDDHNYVLGYLPNQSRFTHLKRVGGAGKLGAGVLSAWWPELR